MRKPKNVYSSKAARANRRTVFGIPLSFAFIAALLVGGGVALAAMLVDSNEAKAKVEAGTAVQLKLSDAVPSGKLYPGMGVDVSFTVANPNPFPVTLATIVAGSGTPSISCPAKTDVKELSSSLLVSGSTLTLPKPVEIGAGDKATVEIKDAVKLGKAASGGCSIEGTFKVTGSGAGSGN